MRWLSDFKQDLSRYSNGGALARGKALLLEPGLWASLQYRVDAAVYRSRFPAFIKAPLRLLLTVWHKAIEALTGISLPCTAVIGPGLHLPHCGFRIVHAAAVVGSNCCISQGATIGISGRGEQRGVPVVGDRVYIGANAVVAGKISVGSDAVIGANSLAIHNVPSRCTVSGVPAKVLNSEGSADYIILPRDEVAARPGAPAGKPAELAALRLIIVARVTHYRHQGRLYSYTPYAREIDVWAGLFSEVIIAGTLREEPPPGDCSALAQANVALFPICEGGGMGFQAKAAQFFLLPKILWQLFRAMRGADAIHVRCPCDLGLLGILIGPLISRRLITKYATQWLPYRGEPWSWRLQRAILASPWWRGPVTVYGEWPNQPRKVIPFFTSMLTREQIGRARRAAERSRNPGSLRILFVGRLSEAKNVDVLLQALSCLSPGARKLECIIVGEGPQRRALEAQAAQLGLSRQVRFTGGVDFEGVLACYEEGDALVLASAVEGWPKAVAEAMAFGLVCIGSERGMMPQMLDKGRGLVVQPRDVVGLTAALQWVVDHPQEAAVMGQRAAQWGQRYSLEGLRDALRDLMNRAWALPQAETPIASSPRGAAIALNTTNGQSC